MLKELFSLIGTRAIETMIPRLEATINKKLTRKKQIRTDLSVNGQIIEKLREEKDTNQVKMDELKTQLETSIFNTKEGRILDKRALNQAVRLNSIMHQLIDALGETQAMGKKIQQLDKEIYEIYFHIKNLMSTCRPMTKANIERLLQILLAVDAMK